MWVENSENLKSRTNVNNLKMKNLKVISIGFVLMFFVFALNGQTEKGNVLIGGENILDFTSRKDDDNDKRTFAELSPQIGFFVVDGLAVGAEIPMSHSSRNSEDGSSDRSTFLAVSPFLRYYFGTSHIKPYLHGEAGFGSFRAKITRAPGQGNVTPPPVDLSTRIFLYEIGGGLGIFLNDKVSLDFGLRYTSVLSSPSAGTDSNSKGITNELGIGIGIVLAL